MIEKIKKIIKKIPPLTLLIPLACLIFLVIYQIYTSKNTSAKCVSIEIVDVTTEQSGREQAAVMHCKIHNSSNRACTFVKGTLTIRDNNGNLLTENDWDFGSWGNFTLSHNESKDGTLTIYCEKNNRLLSTPFSEMKIDIAVNKVTFADPPRSIFRVLYYIILYPFCAVVVFLLGLLIILGFGFIMAAIGIPIGPSDSGPATASGNSSGNNSRAYWDAKKQYDSAARNYRHAMNSPNNQDNARRYQQEMELAKIKMINSGYSPGANSKRAYWDAKKRYDSAARNYRNAMNSPNNQDNARMYQQEMELAKVDMINSGHSEG